MNAITCASCGGVEELHHFRADDKRYEFHLCQRCGNEWTVTVQGEPLAADPITSAEILGVHERLADPDLTLDDLKA